MKPTKFCGNEGQCNIGGNVVKVRVQSEYPVRIPPSKPAVRFLPMSDETSSSDMVIKNTNNVLITSTDPDRTLISYGQRGIGGNAVMNNLPNIEELFKNTERIVVQAQNVSSNPPLHEKSAGEIKRDRRWTTASTTGGTSGLTKMKLIMSLTKLQAMGVDYSLLSQYFDATIGPTSSLDMNSVAVFLQSVLIFDRDTLQNSGQCYSTALAAISKTQTTDYSSISDIVDGLVSIITAFK